MTGAAEAFPQAVVDAPGFTLNRVPFSRVVLQGTSVVLHYEPDQIEIERRRHTGLVAITSPEALRVLLDLPVNAPLPLPLSAVEQAAPAVRRRLPNGSIRMDQGRVTRLAVPPIEARLAVVPARSWRVGLAPQFPHPAAMVREWPLPVIALKTKFASGASPLIKETFLNTAGR